MEPKTIKLKSRSGKMIFEHTCIGNNIRITLELAIKSDADFRGADFRGADLSCADFRGADLPLYCKWSVSYKLDGKIKIGCKVKSIKNWDVFFESNETYDTPRDMEDFKRIQANYNAVKVYLQTMGIE